LFTGDPDVIMSNEQPANGHGAQHRLRHTAVEAQFMVRNVTSPLDRYYLVLVALNEEQVDKVRR
jgi:hypothetical protein